MEDAPLARWGEAAGDVLGYGMGWSGDTDVPQVWLSAEAAGNAAGEVYGWQGEGAAGEGSPSWTIMGVEEGSYAGFRVLEGYDHDADGVYDLGVTAPLSSAWATYAGTAHLFTDPPTLPEAATTEDADVTLKTELEGALLDAWTIGDLDGDGRSDLVARVTCESDVVRCGSYLITQRLEPGTYDVEDVFELTVFGTANQVVDIDLDGHPELFATTADVYKYELPEAGTRLNPEEHADAEALFTYDFEINTLWRGEMEGYGTANRLIVAAPMVEDGSYRGRVFLLQAKWEGTVQMDDLDLRIDGEQAGDEAGTDVVVLPDLNGDGSSELAIGAPGTDGGGASAGSLYIAPGPD